MNKTILYAVGAFGGAMALAAFAKRGGLALTGDAERMAGVSHLYGTSTAQQQITNQAVARNWTDLQNSVFKSQPDFWV